MMDSRHRIVLPGEELATSEEFLPGKFAFEDNGKVFAAVPGTLELDTINRIVNVRSFNSPVILETGDTVFCIVTDVRNSIAEVDILKLEGNPRQISSDKCGTIHISKVSSSYVEEIAYAFRCGDLVRAMVIQVKPSIQLTTVAQRLGVVKAFCMRCRSVLKRKGSELYCEKCERIEFRKIATDYGCVEKI